MSENLIINPGADGGPGGRGGATTQIPGWTVVEGGIAVIRYNTGDGYPGPDSPGPGGRGANFFGGGRAARSRIRQLVALGSPAEIDAGTARYNLSAWLGGYDSQADHAQLRAEFLAAGNQVLASVTLGPVTAADRGNVTGLLQRAADGALPGGARTARLTLTFTRASGSATSSNDGYADALALSLSTASTNLIANPSAEGSTGGGGEPSTQIPGWTTVEGAAAVVRYGTGGGWPTATDPGPNDRAANFFAGGTSARTRLAQVITLPNVTDIDAGRASFTFGGWLGGYLDQQDGARLSVEFRPASGPPLGLVVLGPVTAAERGNHTGLFERTSTGRVPPGSRTARVLLLFSRAGGTSNDGYADALTFTIGVS